MSMAPLGYIDNILVIDFNIKYTGKNIDSNISFFLFIQFLYIYIYIYIIVMLLVLNSPSLKLVLIVIAFYPIGLKVNSR